MRERQPSLQDRFLNALRKSKTPVTMFLVKGVKLQGNITWFDTFSILLRRDGSSQLVYKHSISTIMPQEAIDDLGHAAPEEGGRATLQDVFLSAALDQREQMTMFLVNGVMLQGEVTGYDQFVVLLGRGRHVQLVYKHALSTLQPAGTLDLGGSEAGEGG